MIETVIVAACPSLRKAQLNACIVRTLAFLALLSSGCSLQLPGKPNPKDRPVPAEDVLEFDALYSRHCAGCHGANGRFGPAPPLNDPLYRSIVPQDELEMVLWNGRRQGVIKTPMAPFLQSNGGPLSAAQVQVLVHEIKGVPYRIVRGFEDGKPKVEIVPSGPATARDVENGKSKVEKVSTDQVILPAWGIVTPASASVPPYSLPEKHGSAIRGAMVFSRACAACHGDNGTGVAKDGVLRDKINDVAFLSLISDQALRRIMITGRNDLKMPNYAGKTGRGNDFQPLTSSEIADVSALLGAWRQGGPEPSLAPAPTPDK